jgi:putative oxidoreductase
METSMTSSSLTWNARVRKPIEWLQGLNGLGHLDGLGLLAMRLWLAQEFVQAGWLKLSAGTIAPDWFAQLPFPALLQPLGPDLNWVMAGLGETAFGLAIALGLGSRLAAVGLLFITWVAVYTVHFDLGWMGWNQIETDQGQGFKVPLMMAFMLLTVLTQGGGRYAVDALRQARHTA